MSAPLKNTFYKFRKSHGRDLKYTVEVIEDSYQEYLEFCFAHPIPDKEKLLDKGKIKTVTHQKTQMPTLQGFRSLLGMTPKTWLEYKNRDDFIKPLSAIEDHLSHVQISLAASGICKETIVIRVQGLCEKTETKVELNTHDDWVNSIR